VKGDSEPTPAHVSSCEELSEAIFVTTQVDSFSKRDADSAYRKIEESARITRTWGDCYGYLLIATGRADVMIDPEMHIWDAAAVKPVLEEAGGVFTDWRGQATVHSGEGVGTNRRLLPEVLRALAPHCV
jgi:fructose-1,6-bisphosphatase/inositol monophosphatase family enzyme